MAIINYSFDFIFIKNSCNLGIFLIFFDEKFSPRSLQFFIEREKPEKKKETENRKEK